MVKINGNDFEVSGMNLQEYLDTTDYNLNRIVVERNLEIVAREKYSETILQDGDTVEIVMFMGGGC